MVMDTLESKHRYLHGVRISSCTSTWGSMCGDEGARTCKTCGKVAVDLNHLDEERLNDLISASTDESKNSQIALRLDGRITLGCGPCALVPKRIGIALLLIVPAASWLIVSAKVFTRPHYDRRLPVLHVQLCRGYSLHVS